MFRDILSGIILKWMGFLVSVGLACVLSTLVWNWGWAGSVEPILKGLVVSIGASFLTATVVILVLDLGFRKEFISDVESIFVENQKTLGVGKYTQRRREFDTLIEEDIRTANQGSNICIASVSLKCFFTDSPGIELLFEKIRSGVNVQVLVWHPCSGLVKEYQNLSQTFGSPNLANSLLLAQGGHIRETFRAYPVVTHTHYM